MRGVTMARYRLAMPWTAPFSALLLVLLAGLGVWVLAGRQPGDQGSTFETVFAAVWLFALVVNGYRLCTAVREIEVHEGDDVEFISWVQRVRLHAREILSVRALPGRWQRIVIRHQGGSITLAGPFDQFHQFLAELKQVQPAVEIKGL
jgi:hypothetical protein